MEKNLKVRFKQRTDTAANWAAKNPVLLQGEIGCESDTGNLKIGDGTKAWNDLSYVKEKLAKVATTGSYNDLSNKPTIPTVPGSLKNPYALTFTGAVTGSYDGSAAKSVAIPVVDSALSSASTNAIQNKAVNTALAGKANKATTLAGYGIADAKITNGVITIGSNTITPLTSHQSLAAYAKTTDVNTALAKKADKATALTNQDLNNVKTDGDYYAGGDNTITNKPSGVDAFGLTVYHTAGGYITQDLVEGNKNPQKRYTRQFDTQNWSAWIVMPTFTANPSSGQVLIADGTLGGIKTSGYTIASSVPVNAKFTDTNTWRGVQNNLTSDSTTESLSAAQGKALKTLVDGKAAKATTLSGYGITDAKINNGVITLGSSTITPLTSHQSLANYYTKSSVDTLISNLKAGLVNVVESLPTAGENGKLYLVKTGTEDKNLYTEYVYVNSAWEKLGTQKLDLSGYLTKTDASSTYLGKTAAAASANKLNTNAGSATQPVYFANGVPVATTYTLGKSVPSNAVFTDTNNKVTQTAVTDADYTNYRPLIWGASNSGTKGFTPTTVTDSLFASTGLYVQPSSGLIHATTFEGNLSGTASNASKVNNLTVQTAVPANAKFTDTVYTHPATHAASMITGLATVATSGSYADLSNKPTIPTSLPANGGTATKLSTSAGSATQPIYFSDGKPVACTYTLGKSVPSDAKFTDTNTWRGVQNNLTSTATDQSLSAAQGKYLNENKTTQQNWTASIKCATWSRLCYVPFATSVIGSSFILNVSGTRNNTVYNETFSINVNHSQKATVAKIGTANYSSIQLRVIVDSSGNGYVEIYDNANSATNTTTQSVYCRLVAIRTGTITTYTTFTDGSTIPDGFKSAAVITTNGNSLQGNLTWSEITGKPSSYTPANHTHNYAGSSSAGGSATSAVKLDTATAGSATQPVYFSGGKPVATTYTLSKSVPSDAKFTDTVYTLPDATTSVKGGIKVGSNLTISSGVLSLTKANVTAALGYTPPTTNTDTHYTTGLKVGASATATANAAATNGNVYLNVLDNTTVRDSHNIVGSGATTVTSDANGKITISSTNTVYSHPSTHPASMITGLATVATSGSYSDLSDKPTIPTIPSSLPANGGTATNANNVAINKTNPTTATTYYVPFAANNTGTLPIRGNDGFRYYTLEGTTSAVGQSQLGLGNNIASGTAGNKAGKLYMYGTGTGYTTLTTANTSSNSYTATLPAKNGTVAMTSDIPTIPTSLPANGGTATSANKLNTNAGSATQPVYFTNGVPTACTYTLGASVPSGAKFTDTNTWRGIQNNLTSDSTTDSLSAAQGKVLKGLVDGKAASNHTHSYLPLSGGTLTGSVVGKTTGGSWISGMTVSNLSLYCSQMNKDSYWPFIGGKTYSSNVWNLGGLGDAFGFYVFKSGRTENSTDYRVTINTNTGVLSSSAGFSGSLSGNATSATKATQDSAGQQINTTYIKGLSVSGKTITYTKGDGSTGTITTQDTNTTYGAASSSTLGLVKTGSNITNSSGTISITKDNVVAALGYTPPTTNTTYSNMTAATASAAGKAGLVPAPAAGKQTSFLRGDGTWVVPTNTTYSNMKGATSSAAGSAGLVPAPATGAQGLYLRGDGTWATPTNTTYSAATASALGLVKVGSNITVSSGTISLTKANVTAALGYTPPTTNTTYSNMTAATASAAGKAGLVPAPAAGAQAKFLRGDGTWQNVDTSSAKVKMVVY